MFHWVIVFLNAESITSEKIELSEDILQAFSFHCKNCLIEADEKGKIRDMRKQVYQSNTRPVVYSTEQIKELWKI